MTTGYLTQADINRALTKGTPVTLRDGNGLLFIRGKRKTGWYAEYRLRGLTADGQRQPKRVVMLSAYSPACRLAEARRLNLATQLRVSEGHDVLAERTTERIATIQRSAVAGTTVHDLIQLFVTARHEQWRPATRAAFNGDLAIIDQALGTLPVSAVTRLHLIQFLQGFVTSQHAKGFRATRTERLRMLLAAIFAYAFDLELIEHLPTVRLRLPPSTRARSRERVLSVAEIKATWAALEKIDTPLALALRISLATGARIGAVALAHEDELDLEGRVAPDGDTGPLWRVPGAPGRKARIGQVMPLSALAVSLWGRALAWPGRNPGGPVFPGRGTRRSLHPASFSTQWATWVRAGTLPPDCTPHDLRRTARSWWSNLATGVSTHAMERLLGHAVGGKIERIYDRSLHLPAQRKVADAWGDWLSQLVSIPANEPVLILADTQDILALSSTHLVIYP
jgi:integrase